MSGQEPKGNVQFSDRAERAAMGKISHRALLLQPLLFATALPLVLLAEGATPAYADTVTVTGANGRTGLNGGTAGGSATATTTTPSDASNTATAAGGNGGSSCTGSAASGCFVGPGGAGGAAKSTATTSIGSGAASAEAASFGGAGGAGVGHSFPPIGGNGGAATSNAAASSTTGSASATASSYGGRHGYGILIGAGGSASADATANSAGGGAVQADASAYSGQQRGGASASANAQNKNGTATTTATAPAAGVASALANAAVGPGSSESLFTIRAGQVVSNAILLTPAIPPAIVTQKGAQAIAAGVMSAGYGATYPYGNTNQTLQYKSTAAFDFTTSESLDLDLLSYNVSEIGFDILELQVIVPGVTPRTYTFSSLTGSGGAETFFTSHLISLGAIQTVSLVYELTYNAGTPTSPVYGFGFT
jgi:hypothetical protein